MRKATSMRIFDLESSDNALRFGMEQPPDMRPENLGKLYQAVERIKTEAKDLKV